MNWLRLAVCLSTFLGSMGSTGSANATTVAIVWPSTASAEVTQALTLLRGELLSAGLEVSISDRATTRDSDSVVWLDAFAAQGTNAVINAVGGDLLEAIDVWVLKTKPQRFEVTRVGVQPDDPKQPDLLALRAFEALSAGLLQLDWAARKQRREPTPPIAPAPTAQPQKPSPRDERWGLEFGAAAIMNLDGLSAALLPTLRASWAARPALVVQAAVAGLGSQSKVETGAGNARVGQQSATLGGFYRFRSSEHFWPYFGLAVGGLHTAIEGQSSAGGQGHSATRWSGLLDVSLGAGLHLYGRSYISLAAHAQIAQPYVAVHILDSVVTSGHPNLLLTLTVGAWL